MFVNAVNNYCFFKFRVQTVAVTLQYLIIMFPLIFIMCWSTLFIIWSYCHKINVVISMKNAIDHHKNNEPFQH